MVEGEGGGGESEVLNKVSYRGGSTRRVTPLPLTFSYTVLSGDRIKRGLRINVTDTCFIDTKTAEYSLKSTKRNLTNLRNFTPHSNSLALKFTFSSVSLSAKYSFKIGIDFALQ